MRIVSVAIALLVLISSSAFAQLLLPTLMKQKQIEILEIDRQGVMLFLRGFVVGLEESLDFVALETCIHDETMIAKHIATAIHYFHGSSAEGIEKALKEIARVGEIIPKAIEDCKAASADLRTLIEMIKAFKDPGTFIWVMAKNLIVHGVEIWGEIQKGLEYYRTGDYLHSGVSFGQAMCKCLFDRIQASSMAVANSLNAQPKLWKATHYPQFENMTLWQIKKERLGLMSLELSLDIPLELGEVNESDIPVHFDSREKWKDCIHGIRDQGRCGSCWAFGASEVVSDRFCIATKGRINKEFSPQFLVSCNRLNHGCQGGILAFAWRFLVRKGIVTEECWPYESEKGISPSCDSFTHCKDVFERKFYHVHRGTVKHFLGIERIKKEIMENGPVETGFMVFEDFLQYNSGIYHKTSGRYIGNHAVKMIGWGIENNVKYWIAANSWSDKWGEEGYFRIRERECFIDFAPIPGLPDVD